VQIWPAHGAGSACGKAVGAVPTSTMGYERRFNPAIGAATSEDQFLAYILQGQPEPPLYFARMKRDNMLGPPILGGVPQPPQLTAEVVFSLNPKTVAIIDTRPWGAFQEGHVPRSMSLPLNRAFNTNAGSLVREDEAIVLIVEPARIDEAVRDLIRVGLDNITGWLDPVDLRSDDTNDAALATLGEVTVAEAIQLLDEGLVHVLDVRRATEFDQGHLPGASGRSTR
jgi:hydroxyacylglutathione hydrolase